LVVVPDILMKSIWLALILNLFLLNPYSHARLISDGPLSFIVPTGCTVDFTQAYAALGSLIGAQYSIQLNDRPSPILLTISKTENHLSLESWADHQFKTWDISEVGNIYLAEKFATNAGNGAVSIMRETINSLNEKRMDYFITIDLNSSDQNSTAGDSLDTIQSGWLRAQFSANSEKSENTSMKIALEIAKTLSFSSPQLDTLQEVTEIVAEQSEPLASLPESFADGPLSFLGPSNSLFDCLFAYREMASGTLADYAIESRDFELAFNIRIETEKNIPNLESWASLQKHSYQSSEIGELVEVSRFSTNSGNPGFSVIRKIEIEEAGTFFDYWHTVDLSSIEWQNRYLPTDNSTETPWLKAQVWGVLANQEAYKTAALIAQSLDLNATVDLSLQPHTAIANPVTNPVSGERRQVRDGPVSFLLDKDAQIDHLNSYHEPDNLPQASYSILRGNNAYPFSLFISSENNFESLDDWSAHQQQTWQKSEIGELFASELFLTDTDKSGVYFLRKTIAGDSNESMEFAIGIDLTPDDWSSGFTDTNQTPWLRAHLVGFLDTLNDANFNEALQLARSLNFDSNQTIAHYPFEEVSDSLSPSTNFPVQRISQNWYDSYWFGTFYDGGNGWIYHYKLGWIYFTPLSDQAFWMWLDTKDWLWSNPFFFPYLFSEKSRNWIYLNLENTPDPRAYDFVTGKWTPWSQFNLPKYFFSPEERQNEINRVYYSDKTYQQKIDKIAELIFDGLK